jgi:hypothetical protein
MNHGAKLILLSSSRPTLSQVIAAIFPSGSDGAVYLSSDVASEYTDSIATSNSALGQAVGLAVDERFGLSLGPNIVLNGTFADATGWTLVSGATVGSGKLQLNAPVGNVVSTYTLVTNKTYRATNDVLDFASGSLRINVGGAQLVAQTANGSYSQAITATGTTSVRVLSTGSPVCSLDNLVVSEILGNQLLQSTSASRPVLTSYGGYSGQLFDGVDDSLASLNGGGGTTGFFWCGAVRVIGGDGTARTIWSDVGTNTGYQVTLTSGNKVALGAGNGVGYTSATTAGSALAGNTYVQTLWDDGTNLNAQINLGAVAQTARPTVSAGGAGFSIAKDANASTGFANIAIFAQVYRKNGGVSDAARLKAQRWCAAQAGLSI